MLTKRRFMILIVAVALLVSCTAFAQTRSPWEQHDGLEVTTSNLLGLLAFTCSPAIHGDPCEYDVATIPDAAHIGWGPAPDPDTINFSIYPSRVCQAPISCWAYGDFTYFQTFVDIPLNFIINQFTIAFSGMDDGARVSIFNSTYPDGIVVPGSYVFLGGSGTSDLAPYVNAGEINRVVVTQVDDCCVQNNLYSAIVVLNGEIVIIDPDTDDDDVPDSEDNCPETFNPDQADSDLDGVGDACDVCPYDADDDLDDDGVCGDVDNCPENFNPDQADYDGDGIGDECDDDADDDGVTDDEDECLFTDLGDLVNEDGCSIEQLCPCENDWKNHGAYVKCVAHVTNEFKKAGLITGAEKGAIVSEAGRSDCGQKKTLILRLK